MPQASGKRSIPSILIGATLLAGTFLPWRSALDGSTLIGFCPGCTLYDQGAATFAEASGVGLTLPLIAGFLAGIAFIASGLLRDRPKSRWLAFGGLGLGLSSILLSHRAFSAGLTDIADSSSLPSYAASWSGAEGFAKFMGDSQLGLGLFLVCVSLTFGLFRGFGLLGEAKEDDGTTWLTPLAQRSWFFELLEDFWFFLIERKAWWMTPIFVVLAMLVLLIIVSEKAAVLPFIYTLF